nr:ORF2 [Porcine astrovirus 4]
MANNQNNVQPKVVTTTTTTTRRRGGRRRRRTPRTPQAGTTTVRKVTVNRQLGRPRRRRRNRPGIGGKQATGGIRQRITATLGTVGSNQGNSIELEMSTLLNPALMKETTGSNQYGPLQIYASTYNLWKIETILLKLTPLVGSSAVSGTAIRASLNLSGQPGSPSWSALGARKHKDTNPGRPLYFYLNGSDLKGPKDGWFFCNTKNDPKMCIAGSLEIHTLGQTVSTYQNGQFTGPLFLAEMTCVWSFKDYNPQPGMLNLVKAELKEQPQNVKINAKPGEPINISVPADAALARTVSFSDLGVTAGATPADIIWQVADTTMDVVTGAFPPPFQWLFRAGWWFLKRIANRKQNGDHVDGEPDAGEVVFQVYQSMTDAMNDTPCIATGTATSTNTVVTGWNITQVTPGNLGQPQASTATYRMAGLDTTKPFFLFRTRVSSGEPILTGMNYNYPNGIPLNGFSVQETTSTKRAHSYYSYELIEPYFYQDVQIDPATADVPTYPMLKKQADNYTRIGTIYGTSEITTTGTDKIRWTLALWRADQTTTVIRQPGNNANLEFFILRPELTQSGGYPTTGYTMQVARSTNPGQQTVNVEKGKWYLTPFTALNGRVEFTNYGAKFPMSTSLYSGTTLTFDPSMDFFYTGLALNNAVPLRFNFPQANPTAVTFSMVQEMVHQALTGREYQDLPFPPLPPPSEHDNLEMPPLEEEEEQFQGAVGGAEPPLETRNWVEFGHRKRPPTPFSPIGEEEEENEEDSEIDDDDYAEPPVVIKNLLTPEAKDLYGYLRRKGLSHEQATNAAQAAFPHIALEAWDAAYHNAMADGLSPPTARDCAWKAVSDFLS